MIKSKTLKNGTVVVLSRSHYNDQYALSVDNYWCSGYNMSLAEASDWLDTITMSHIQSYVCGEY